MTSWTWQYVNSPLASHGLNLGLHLLLAGAVLGLAYRIGLRGLGLWAVAVIWLLHPLNVETVAYAASRGELLAAIGVVGACVLACGAWWRWLTLAGIVSCLGLAVLSKESGVVGLLLVPFVIACRRVHAPVPRWLPAVVALGLLGVGIERYGGLRAVVNMGTTDFVHATSITWVQWVGTQAAATRHWLWAAIAFEGLTLDPDLDAVTVLGRIWSVGLLGLLATWAWLARRDVPIVAFGVGFLLLGLLPRFVVQTPQSYLSAHQFTVPWIGPVLMAGWGMTRLAQWADGGTT